MLRLLSAGLHSNAETRCCLAPTPRGRVSGVKQLGQGASQVSPHPENKTPRLLRSQPFITQPQEEEDEREKGALDYRSLLKKGLKRCPSLSFLLNQPPHSLFFLSILECFPSSSLARSLCLFLAEDKQRNSRISVCLDSR